MGRWHYIFNEASRLFSCTVVEQRAECRTLTPGAHLTSHQQTASSGGAAEYSDGWELSVFFLAGRTLTERVTTGCLTASRSSPSDPLMLSLLRQRSTQGSGDLKWQV